MGLRMKNRQNGDDIVPPPLSDKGVLSHVREYYRDLYERNPSLQGLVRTGRLLAADLGYPLESLQFIPDDYWERFLPCGNPLPMIHALSGERVLNLGCGVGIDSFALQATEKGHVTHVGMDVVVPVLQGARTLAASIQPKSQSAVHPQHSERLEGNPFHWVCGSGGELPFRPESFSWVLLNGVLNLFPDKLSLLAEVRRVLLPGGHLVGTDLCCEGPLPDYFAGEADAWAWCMSGACTAEDLMELFREAGFLEIGLFPQEEGEMFHRVAFCCTKGGDYRLSEVRSS